MYNICVRKIKSDKYKTKKLRNKWETSVCSWLIGAIIVKILFIPDLI